MLQLQLNQTNFIVKSLFVKKYFCKGHAFSRVIERNERQLAQNIVIHPSFLIYNYVYKKDINKNIFKLL